MATAATVVSVQGEAFVRSANGSMRRLSGGDSIQQDEVVITSAGGQVSLRSADGQMIVVNAQESFKFGPEASQATAPDVGEAAIVGGSAAPTVIATQAGEIDVEQLLEQEAAAATLAGGGENGGNSFVRLLRITEEVTPLAYEFPTAGPSEILPFNGVGGAEITDTSPVPAADVVAVNEDGLEGGNPGGVGDIGTDIPASIVGDMTYSFGDDGPAATDAFRWTGVTLPGGEDVYSGGELVQYEISEDGLTIRAFIEGPGYGEDESPEQITVFEVVVTDPVTGTYEMTLYRPLDHTGANEDDINYGFNYQLTDGDGSTAAGTLALMVDDDTPVWQYEEDGVFAQVTESTMAYGDGDLSQGNQTGGISSGYFAELASSGSGNQSSIEAFLEVASGGLSPLAASGGYSTNATNGSAMKTTLNVTAGDEISFSWAFDADDYLNYNDFAFVAINGTPIELADISQVGSYGATSWASFTYTATSTGPLTIGFGVMNTGDSGVNTYLLVDQLRVNGVTVANGDFESGDFSNWQILGTVNPVTYHDEIGMATMSDEASGMSGSLAGLVAYGADGPGVFGLLTDTSSLPTLYSKGEMVGYTVAGNTLTATAGAGEDARVVFTLTVNENGSWDFDLTDQLDHVPGGGQNSSLVTGEDGEGGFSSVPSIDFSSLIQATDGDGDVLDGAPAGSFTITVQDDVPILDVGLADSGEDSQGMPMPNLTTQDAETDGTPTPEDVASSSFAGLFTLNSSVGADEPGTKPALAFSLSIGEMADTGLTSQGNLITLAMDGNDIVGNTTVGTGEDAIATPIFRISVDEATGVVTLTQYAQMDHTGEGEDGDASNNSASFLGLPEGSIILTASASITDADGDTATDSQNLDISGAFGFEDDVPTVDSNAIVQLDDEGLEDGIPGGLDDVAGEAITFSGTLAHAFGADAPGSIGFASMDGQTGMVGTEEVTYAWDDETNTLTATGPRGALFTVEITDPATGAYTVTLLDNVLHDFAAEMSEENNASVELTYTVTDGDGDAVKGSLNLDFDDDMPKAVQNEMWIKLPVAEAINVNGLAAGWVAPFDPNVDFKYNTDGDSYFEKIDWGTDGGRSSYEFADATALVGSGGATVDPGTPFVVGTFTHNNFPITTGTSITTAHLQVTFNLLIGGHLVHIDHTIEFGHNETDNSLPDPRDIVTILNGTGQIVIPVGGQDYSLSFKFDGGLSEIRTSENASTSVPLYVTLTAPEIDLPQVEGAIELGFGADGPAASGLFWPEDADGDGVIEGEYGMLTVDANGGYVYTVNEYDPAEVAKGDQFQDEFTYILTDADGDAVVSTLTINLVGMGAADSILSGGAGADTLSGGVGDDILIGGAGSDTLAGGLGADTFVWRLADVGDGTGPAPHDLVTDFSVAEGDVLDLSSVLSDSAKEIIAVDSGGKLGLQVVDAADDSRVYQEITVESIAFGTDEANNILNNLKDHGTSNS
ncbi:MAG: retention module-containing protein [Rhodocyclaceae bacterium]|nr:retention module-containing protein [Rhodocyclaceae bacterium]